MTPRVLVVTPGHDDFLVDGLVHGLRQLLGSEAVEVPRIDHLYRDYPADRTRGLHGMGFTLAGLFDGDAAVDRDRALYRAAAGAFDLVIFADIWRTFGQWTQWMPQLRAAGVRLAVIDGSDRVEPYPNAGLWWRVRPWWTLPRVRGRATHFKREVTPWTGWFRSYLLVPGPLASALKIDRRGYRRIGFAIPSELIASGAPSKSKDWPAHIVDAEVAARVGGSTAYAFEDADAYHADLRSSRFGVTTKKAGWDALRHLEIAAAGAVPCFRNLDRKPTTCAPFGLRPNVNCLSYEDADDLLRQTSALEGPAYERLRLGSISWAQANTTLARAGEVLSACGLKAP